MDLYVDRDDSVDQLSLDGTNPLSTNKSSTSSMDNHKKNEKHHGRGSRPQPRHHRHATATTFESPLGSLKDAPRILRFAVKDYGRGIDPADFGRIFKPFKQANSYTETLYGGTGLGLAITTKLVQALGGTIQVDSVLGQWTEFTVDLPCLEESFDMTSVARELQSTTTVLSVHASHDNINRCGGTTVEQQLMEQQGIPCLCFDSMQTMLTKMEQPGILVDPRRFYIVMAEESLYDADAYQKFFQLVRNQAALVTHGPGYSIKETNLHYRSLEQVLPSVLMSSILAQMKTSRKNLHTRGSFLVDAVSESNNNVHKPIAYDQIRCLIAEDNKINQKVLGRMLKRLGVTHVEMADNGEIAVAKAAANPYDIIFMDMQMPVMDGLEATQKIVEHRGTNPLPKVIFVTVRVTGCDCVAL